MKFKFSHGVRLGLLAAGLLLALISNASTAASEIGLSLAEKRWLAEHPTIRLAVDIDWLPFEYIDENHQYSGMAAEYAALVGEKLGIEFEVEKNKSWSEVVDAVKNRELDMFSCVVETEQRKEYVDFTRPYLSFPMVIVTSDKVAYVNGIKGSEQRKGRGGAGLRYLGPAREKSSRARSRSGGQCHRRAGKAVSRAGLRLHRKHRHGQPCHQARGPDQHQDFRRNAV